MLAALVPISPATLLSQMFQIQSAIKTIMHLKFAYEMKHNILKKKYQNNFKSFNINTSFGQIKLTYAGG